MIELLSPTDQINNIYYHLQSTSMLVFVSQSFYMITTHIYYQSEKEEFAKHYVGELCDIMAYYWSQRKIVICSFFFALFLKQYNLYYLTYLEIHIEAKQRNLKVQDIIKLKYYTFYTETLRDSENTLSYFQKKRTYFQHLVMTNYLLLLMLAIKLGFEHRDNQLINMGLICIIDIVVEVFELVPNWRRRQLLILDEVIQIIYGSKDLWHPQVYIKAFAQDKMGKEPTINDLMDENLLIKDHYGVEVIEQHIVSLKQRKLEKTQFLRSLAQHQQTISDSKQRLPAFYMVKFFLVAYWVMG